LRQKPVHIYAMWCPLSWSFRYIGKTIEPLSRRLSKHLRHSTRHYNKRKHAWLSHLECRELKPIMVLLETVKERDRICAEYKWIKRMTEDGCDLLNRRRPC
jgi:hypothetical protein